MKSAETKARVLFVDDEEDVLAGLRTGLRRERKRFHCEFALGGAAALESMAATHFDIVVSDMRMPEMNGVQLLTEVAHRHPEVVRIVLSGEAGSDLLIQALHITHQWLAKPCTNETLVAALDNAVRYRSLLHSHEVQKAIVSLDALPTPPDLYQRVVDCATSLSSSVDDVAAIVAEDPAVTSKVLQLANSAFACSGVVADLQTAIVRIGIENLSRLVLVAGLLDSWADDYVIPGMPSQVCIDVAHAAAIEAATLAPAEMVGKASIAALLHPVGLMLMAVALPELLDEAVQHARAKSIDVVAAGRALHGMDHALLAGHLLSVWGLPSDIVLAVVGSVDEPDTSAGGVDPLTLDDVVRRAVRAAQAKYVDELDQSLLLPTVLEEVA